MQELVLQEQDFRRKGEAPEPEMTAAGEPADSNVMLDAEGRPVKGQELDAFQQKLVQDAIEESERILASAREEAEKIRSDAYEQGFNEGHREGMETGRDAAVLAAQAEVRDTLKGYQQDVASALKAIGEERDLSFRNYLEELKNVALAVAEKVIHVSLETSGEIIRRMILTEAEKLKRTEWVRIYIDKMDYERLIEVDADVAEELSKVTGNVKFVVMEREDSGYVVIETPQEVIDIGVDTQMENIRENLNGIDYV